MRKSLVYANKTKKFNEGKRYLIFQNCCIKPTYSKKKFQLIDEEIKDAERNNAILKLKNKVQEADLNDEFGATLYSDQLSPEKKVVKSFEEDIWVLHIFLYD